MGGQSSLDTHGIREGGGLTIRRPQSVQSVPLAQKSNSDPSPPSSQSPSLEYLQVSLHDASHGGGAGGGGDGGEDDKGQQPEQSQPYQSRSWSQVYPYQSR